MNCTYHFQNQVSFICIASHKCQCQRKLCNVYQFKHDVDKKQIIPIEIFQEMAQEKLQQQKLDEKSMITQQRMAFKKMLSETSTLLKKIWEELSQTIQQIYDEIEKENQSYINLVSCNMAEASYTDIEKLVSIVEGKTLIDWKDKKNQYMMKLEENKFNCERDIQVLMEQLQRHQQNIKQFTQSQQEDVGEDEPFIKKDNLYDILNSDIDTSMLKEVIGILRKEKSLNILQFLEQKNNIELYQSLSNNKKKISEVKRLVQRSTYMLKNILEHPLSKTNYSEESNNKVREDFVKKIQTKQSKKKYGFINITTITHVILVVIEFLIKSKFQYLQNIIHLKQLIKD